MPAQTYGLPSLSDLTKLAQAAHSPTAKSASSTQQVQTGWSFGPFTFGMGSLLGNAAANASEISSGIAQANAAYSKANPNASPIDYLTNAANNVGKLAGYTLGGIAQVGGAALGNEATSAAPGVASGTGAVAQGVVDLGTQTAIQGLLGTIQGLFTGLQGQTANLPGGANTSGGGANTSGGGTSNMKTYLLIGGGLLLLFLLLKLLT